jgi:hypothetical protein
MAPAAMPLQRRDFPVMAEPFLPFGVPVMQNQPDRAFPLDPVDDVSPRLRGQAPQTMSQTARDWEMAGNVAGFSGGLAPRVGIRAFHGSPHDFDRFRMDRIGTGEGAQAYGHGLYFAEAEDVAQAYRRNLAGGLTDRNGAPFRLSDDQGARNAYDLLRSNDYDYGKTIDMLRGYQRGARGSYRQELDASLDWLDTWRGAGVRPEGRMYEVNLNVDPNRLLDWDAPLSQQPRIVQEAVHDNFLGVLSREPGSQIYRDMGGLREPGERAVRASERLRDAGIPGIRYLDGGSRAAGSGTRNYVMFDDSLIEILRKYGLAGLGLGLGAGATQAEAAR